MELGFWDLRTYGRVIADREPDFCPHCGKSCHPTMHFNKVIERNPQAPTLEVICECPDYLCGRLFITHYTLGASKPDAFQIKGFNEREFKLQKYTPAHMQSMEYPESIQKLSPSFVAIYHEAETAEAVNLTEVCGLGYRKALEFLIKDYCSYLHPEKTDAIKKQLLSSCIKEYLNDPRIKTCAERATWLGNDEAHYVRRWEDKDISDLKILVRMTCNWIENDLLTVEYQQSMPHPGAATAASAKAD